MTRDEWDDDQADRDRKIRLEEAQLARDRQLAIRIPASMWWTANSRLHHMEKARRTKHVRLLAAHMARSHLLAPMNIADVHILVQTPTARRFDADNAAPMAKAAIDGIVDARVLPDDDARHRPRTTYELGQPTREAGMYRLTITLKELP